jgi:hypothetical protein
MGAAPPRRRRSRVVILVVVIVAIGLVTAGVALQLLVPPPPPIEVGAIDVWAPDNVCGLSSNPVYYGGYNSSTGQAIAFELEVLNYNATACTVNNVTTNTTGFSLSDVQPHVTIPADGNSTMNLTVTSPTSPFSGNLNLLFR